MHLMYTYIKSIFIVMYWLIGLLNSLRLNTLKKNIKSGSYFVSQYLAALFVVYKTFVAFGKQKV